MIKAKIGDLADVTKLAGFEYSKYFEYLDDGEIIALRGLNVKNGNLDLKNVKKISKSVSEKLPRSKLFKGDILLTYTGTIGEVAIIEEDNKYHLAPNVALVRAKNIDPYFLYSLMRTNYFKNSLKKFSVGSTQKTIPMKNIRQIEIFYFEESIKYITNFIKQLDKKIKINEKINETLEEISKTLYKSWFVDFDPVRKKAEGRPTGLLNEISDLFPDSFENSEFGEIPKGWNVKNLKDTSLYIESGTRPKGGIDKSLSEGIPSVGAESLQNIGTFDYSNIKFVKKEFAESVSRGWVEDYDVLIYKDGAKVGDPTRVGLYGNGFPFKKFLINEHVFIVRSKDLGQPFLYNLFKSDRISNELQSIGTSKAAQPGLNQKEVLSCKFVAPPKDLVNAFNQIIFESINQSLSLGRENRTLSELFELLLPKLISGELKIPDTASLIEETGV